MERSPATNLHLVENPATNPLMEARTNLATNLPLEEMELNLATNLPIVEVVENPATNLLPEADQVANLAINPAPTVSQASNPATKLQATIRSIPVAIGNLLIKTIYRHLKQCKYVISFCVFL